MGELSTEDAQQKNTHYSARLQELMAIHLQRFHILAVQIQKQASHSSDNSPTPAFHKSFRAVNTSSLTTLVCPTYLRFIAIWTNCQKRAQLIPSGLACCGAARGLWVQSQPAFEVQLFLPRHVLALKRIH